MIKGSIHKASITVVNKCAPIIRTFKYIKQILTEVKGETATQ
jgi:hypothetical protein